MYNLWNLSLLWGNSSPSFRNHKELSLRQDILAAALVWWGTWYYEWNRMMKCEEWYRERQTKGKNCAVQDVLKLFLIGWVFRSCPIKLFYDACRFTYTHFLLFIHFTLDALFIWHLPKGFKRNGRDSKLSIDKFLGLMTPRELFTIRPYNRF